MLFLRIIICVKIYTLPLITFCVSLIRVLICHLFSGNVLSQFMPLFLSIFRSVCNNSIHFYIIWFSITLFSYILCFLDTLFKCPNYKHFKKFNLSSFGTINMLLFAWHLLRHYTNCHLTMDTSQLITLNTMLHTLTRH